MIGGGNFSLQPAPYLVPPQVLQHQQQQQSDDIGRGEVAAAVHFDRLQQDNIHLLPSKQTKNVDTIMVGAIQPLGSFLLE